MIHNRKVAALIPIKDHSERVKGKNFREFCGKPLFHHIIHTLDRTYAVDEIIIDTDSERILSEAPSISSKVKVIKRLEDLQGDHVSTNRIFEYDLTKTDADIYIQTHTTNPLLKAETIADALNTFLTTEKYDSLFSVNKYQSRFYQSNGLPINHDPENLIRTKYIFTIFYQIF